MTEPKQIGARNDPSKDAEASTHNERVPQLSPEPEVRTLKAIGRREIEVVSYSSKLDVIETFKKQRAAGPKEGDSMLDIQVNHEGEELLLPEALYENDNHLVSLALMKASYKAGYNLITYKSDRFDHKGEPTEEVRNFWMGFMLGIDDNININVSKKSNSVELGRATAFAIRVRGHFRLEPKLSSKALKRSQALFGNDPQIDPRTKVVKEGMILDTYLEQYLRNKNDVKACKHALTTLLETHNGLYEELSSANYAAMIRDNLLKSEFILDKYRRIPKGDTRPKKRDSKKATKGKLPEKPTSSPIMTKDEMKTISDILSPIWTNLTILDKDWTRYVLDNGFDRADAVIAITLRVRWECLEALAAVTTARLREIKSQLKDNKMTKRRVSTTDFDAWYAERPDREVKWLLEMAQICKPLASMSIEQRKLTTYPGTLHDQSRKMQADSLQLRTSHAIAKAEASKPEQSIEREFEGQFFDMKKIGEGFLSKQLPKNMQAVSFELKGKTVSVKLAKSQLRDMLRELEDASELSSIGIKEKTIDEKIVNSELARERSGPNSLLGKALTHFVSDDAGGEILLYPAKLWIKGSEEVYGYLNLFLGRNTL
jgi:hypothetical protein